MEVGGTCWEGVPWEREGHKRRQQGRGRIKYMIYNLKNLKQNHLTILFLDPTSCVSWSGHSCLCENTLAPLRGAVHFIFLSLFSLPPTSIPACHSSFIGDPWESWGRAGREGMRKGGKAEAWRSLNFPVATERKHIPLNSLGCVVCICSFSLWLSPI